MTMIKIKLPPLATTTLEIAIRDETLVFIDNLPRDLTEQEAEKICKLIKLNVKE